MPVRLRATHDYQVNLKAELEIRHLHQKVDHLMSHQWEMLVGIQEVQAEFLDAIRSKKGKEEEMYDNPSKAITVFLLRLIQRCHVLIGHVSGEKKRTF